MTQHGNRFFADDVKAWDGNIQDWGGLQIYPKCPNRGQTRQMTNGGREKAMLERQRRELGF